MTHSLYKDISAVSFGEMFYAFPYIKYSIVVGKFIRKHLSVNFDYRLDIPGILGLLVNQSKDNALCLDNYIFYPTLLDLPNFPVQ